jgi:hypothetical protein
VSLNLKRKSFALACVAILVFVTGCLTPVRNEVPLATGNVMDKPASANDTRLVIFNDSDFLAYGLDGSGRINVNLNGQGVAQVKIGQYAQVVVPHGQYQVDLAHMDIATFSSHHQIELRDPVSFLEIFATPTANEAFLVSRPPSDFDEKFKPVGP